VESASVGGGCELRIGAEARALLLFPLPQAAPRRLQPANSLLFFFFHKQIDTMADQSGKFLVCSPVISSSVLDCLYLVDIFTTDLKIYASSTSQLVLL
jgi:hypothetical protein